MVRKLVLVMAILSISAIAFAQAPTPAQAPSQPLATAVVVQTAFEKADQMWLERDGTAKSAREGLKMMEDYLAQHPDDFEALWRASRFCFWICDRTEDSNIKKEFGMKGYQYGEKIMAKWPTKVEGYYYYTINLGEYGKGISIPKAIAIGLNKKFQKTGEKAIAIDKAYEQCGPLRAMGKFYYSLPWPLYSGEKSIKYLDEAVKVCPNKIRSYHYLAETLIKEKRYPEAREVIKKGLAVDKPIPTDPWEDKFYRDELKKLLESIKNKGK